MTLNYDAPAKVTTRYQSSDGLVHKCSFHVRPDPDQEAEWASPGADLAFYAIIAKNGATKSVQDAVNEFWHGQGGIVAPDGFRTMFHSSTQFLTVEVVRYAPLSNTPIWVTETDFDYNGTSLIAMTANSQHTWVGKSNQGDLCKLVFLDVGSGNVSSFVARGAFNANQNQMNWALTHTASCVIAKGGGHWTTTRGFWGGQNEAIFKKRHRS